ncbi:hypothetical protein FHE65_35910 [Mumia zhuanghuii]|uniref:Uncharacterized protein n=1 Tax=Mumia zhuanghuii TaxID=2585211 RepID=A0A5C4LT40_9ACTN|nr:hypothetical protein FHE65_36185 [Mumia zhuanghuii]TNC22187.1 hypothetical protein FHE65_35910 [Mumia zhuanghuii]
MVVRRPRRGPPEPRRDRRLDLATPPPLPLAEAGRPAAGRRGQLGAGRVPALAPLPAARPAPGLVPPVPGAQDAPGAEAQPAAPPPGREPEVAGAGRLAVRLDDAPPAGVAQEAPARAAPPSPPALQGAQGAALVGAPEARSPKHYCRSGTSAPAPSEAAQRRLQQLGEPQAGIKLARLLSHSASETTRRSF